MGRVSLKSEPKCGDEAGRTEPVVVKYLEIYTLALSFFEGRSEGRSERTKHVNVPRDGEGRTKMRLPSRPLFVRIRNRILRRRMRCGWSLGGPLLFRSINC